MNDIDEAYNCVYPYQAEGKNELTVFVAHTDTSQLLQKFARSSSLPEGAGIAHSDFTRSTTSS